MDTNNTEREFITLVDEDGKVIEFELIDAVEMDGVQYFAMIPAIESEEFLNDDGELVILKAIEDNGEEILASIDDDDEFEKVSQYFLKRLEELFEGCDDDCCCDEECHCGDHCDSE
jgi:uncharacterized protein YrzB (UPF0473 family)